ncbi:glycosyltransferase [Leptolyngbya sp. ST-U4]
MKSTIKSLCLQCFSPDRFEILVVDNGSTDNTKDITRAAINEFSPHQIRYIYEPEPGLLSGRHRGALEAKGEILTFVDDDIEADPEWLRAIKESFDDPTVKLVGGRNLPKYEVEPPAWLEWFWTEHPFGKVCVNLSLLDFGDQVREINANYVWGLNFSIRKSALFELGGFHPDCISKHLQHFQGDGETGLTQKANAKGYKAIYQPKALLFHQVLKQRMTYEYFDRRYFYQGVCDSYSEIRRNNSQLILNAPKEGFIETIKRPLRFLKKAANRIVNRQTEQEMLQQRFYKAYQDGYQFHQSAVREKPELLNWILRKDYWDYKLPEFSATHD